MPDYIETPNGGIQLAGALTIGNVTASDTFTDTSGVALSSHTPDTGGSWALHPSYVGTAQISSANRARENSSGFSTYLESTVPGSPDYSVQVDLYAFSFPFRNYAVGLVARYDSVSDTGYRLRYVASTGNWTLQAISGGTSTTIGSYAQSLSALTTYTTLLTLKGSMLTVSVNGSVIIGPVTDSSISAAGRGGVFFQDGSSVTSDTVGIHLDNWSLTGVGTLYAANPAASGGLQSAGSVLPGYAGLIAPAGGIQVSGAGVPALSITFGPSGGIQADGSVSLAKNYVIAAAGGLQLDGVADPTIIFGSGGLQLGGSTGYIWGGTWEASGGLQLGGHSDTLQHSYQQAAGGGVQLAGEADPSLAISWIPSGGVQVVGRSDPTSAWYAVLGMGGIQAGGAITSATMAWGYPPSGGIQASGAASPLYAGLHVSGGGIQLAGSAGTLDILYNIYADHGTGDPIDYSTPIASTYLLTWTSSILAGPAWWKFGVRASRNGLEEKNLDCFVQLKLSADGKDITNVPLAPTGLSAFSLAGGVIRVLWLYPSLSLANVQGFHVYRDTGTGVVNYGTPAASVLSSAALAGSFHADLTGLTDDTLYTIGVRAYNATDEERNNITVTATADATGPTVIEYLTATATADLGV